MLPAPLIHMPDPIEWAAFKARRNIEVNYSALTSWTGKNRALTLEDLQTGVDVFTQNHYIKIAAAIDEDLRRNDADVTIPSNDRDLKRKTITEFAHGLITMFEADNPKFKKFQFIEAAFGPSNALRATKE